MCEEQGDKTKVTYSRDVVASITELVWRNIKIWTKDVEAFARYVIDRHSKQHRSRFERSHNIEPTMMTKKKSRFPKIPKIHNTNSTSMVMGGQTGMASDRQSTSRTSNYSYGETTVSGRR